jgi:hypothetical protein
MCTALYCILITLHHHSEGCARQGLLSTSGQQAVMCREHMLRSALGPLKKGIRSQSAPARPALLHSCQIFTPRSHYTTTTVTQHGPTPAAVSSAAYMRPVLSDHTPLPGHAYGRSSSLKGSPCCMHAPHTCLSVVARTAENTVPLTCQSLWRHTATALRWQ